MGESVIQLPADGVGRKVRSRQRVVGANTVEEQYFILQDEKVISYQGCATTFITPGRAAVTQRLFALHNATAAPVLVRVNRLVVDVLITAIKAPTVVPPIIRMQRFTALPTGGTALAKSPRDSALTSNASVTAYGDASADGTVSASALTVTPISTLEQAYAPRMLTAAGVEPVDTLAFLFGEPDIILRPLEGLALSLDAATLTTGNPATDRWSAYCDWDEYTLP